MSSSDITIIPERFCGLRVLLVEDDIMLLLDHANRLQKSSYEVTVATEASAALSIIKNGETFDCLLIDGDLCQEDMEPFLRQVWSYQSQMSIIVMAAYDTHLRVPKESKESGAVLSLLRPRCYTDICNIWKHICRNKISSEGNISEENLHKEGQIDSNVPRVDPRVEPSAINGSTAINNNILLEHGVSFEDFFLEDNGGGGDAGDQEDVVEIIRKENIGVGAARKEDNGKKPLIPKRKCDKPVEDDEDPTKMGAPKVRIRWKGELEEKFQNALKELGVNATSNEIRNYMNVPGLTRHHVASHQQKYRSKRRNLEANIAELAKKGTTFQVVGIANKRSRHSIQPKENAPVIESSGILRLPEGNYKGILYMLVENIRAILLQRDTPSLSVPQPTTTPNNYYGGDRAIFHSSRGKGIEIQQTGQVYRNVMVTGDSSSHPAFGEAMAPPKAPLGGTAYCFGNPAIAHGSSRKGIEIQPMGQVYGNEMVAGGSSSHPAFGEAMAPLGGTARSFGDPATVRSSSGGGKGIEIQPMGQVYGNEMVAGESSSPPAFGEAMAPLGGTTHSFGDPATVRSSSGGGKGIEIQPIGKVYGNALVTGESSSQHAFGEAMAPLGGTAHSFGDPATVRSSSGKGIEIQPMGQVYGNEIVAGESSPHPAFGEAMAPLGGTARSFGDPAIVRSSSGGKGIVIQPMGQVYGNVMVTGESSPQHAFGEAMTPLGGTAHSFGDPATVHSSSGDGKGIETQPMGQVYGNAMMAGESSSQHAFGEAMAPLGGHQTTTAHSFGVVGNSNFGGQGTGIQMMEPDYGNVVMDPMVAGEASPHHAFGEAMAPIDVDNYGGDQETIHSIGVVENSNIGGQGTGIQLMEHDYKNELDALETAETSLHNAFGDAMTPFGGDQAPAHSFGVVENSNSGGQGTGIQLMEHDYKNELDAMATGETSLHHAFGDAMTPFGGDQAPAHSFGVVENANSGGQGTYAMEPRVSGEISSPLAFGEAMAPLGVGATVASDNDMGYNRLQNGIDNGILGDSSGSRSNEVQVQFPCFEPEPECLADFGGNNVNVNHNLEAVNSPDVFSFDARELYPSQDVQVNIEDLDLAPDSPPLVTFLDLENNKNSGSDLDSMPSGPASADISIPEIPTEENDNPAQSELPGNSIFPVNSDAGFMDNLPCDSDLENLMNFLEGNDGNLFDESFYR